MRDRLALVLDVPSLEEAEALAGELSEWFGVAKVGLELFTSAGPPAVESMRKLGFDVFADLKLYDIPTTVNHAAKAIGRLGAKYLNFPAVGGVAMLRAGVEGFLEGAEEAGHPRPVPLAVTVLTSESDPSAFGERLAAAVEAGCAGVVCSALEVPQVKEQAPGLLTVTPGIRLAGSDKDDQARVATPGAAVAAGADLLVVGRTVTHAADRVAAARAVADEVAGSPAE